MENQQVKLVLKNVQKWNEGEPENGQFFIGIYNAGTTRYLYRNVAGGYETIDEKGWMELNNGFTPPKYWTSGGVKRLPEATPESENLVASEAQHEAEMARLDGYSEGYASAEADLQKKLAEVVEASSLMAIIYPELSTRRSAIAGVASYLLDEFESGEG